MSDPVKISFFRKLWKKAQRLWKRDVDVDVDVYFISGMCYNCKVFGQLTLPPSYNSLYIEWLIPSVDEALEEYARRMAESIDQSKPFVLIGYSFGGIVVQEMNKFLSPLKTIIISSFKREEETPMAFRLARRIHLTEKASMRVFASTQLITDIFNRLVYNMPTSEIGTYMTIVDPVYIKWAVMQIISWIPDKTFPHLYHIQGTKDQIFSHEKMEDVYLVPEGDHLMILKKSEEVSNIIKLILMKKE